MPQRPTLLLAKQINLPYFRVIKRLRLYPPQEEKSALNSEVRLQQCGMRLNCIQIRMRKRGIYVFNKEVWPNARSAIVHVTACRPAQNGAYFLLRIEGRHSDFDKL